MGESLLGRCILAGGVLTIALDITLIRAKQHIFDSIVPTLLLRRHLRLFFNLFFTTHPLWLVCLFVILGWLGLVDLFLLWLFNLCLLPAKDILECACLTCQELHAFAIDEITMQLLLHFLELFLHGNLRVL